MHIWPLINSRAGIARLPIPRARTPALFQNPTVLALEMIPDSKARKSGETAHCRFCDSVGFGECRVGGIQWGGEDS